MKEKRRRLSWALALLFYLMPQVAQGHPQVLTIGESIRLALGHSPVIKSAEAELEKRAWSVKENKSAYLPNLSAAYLQSRNHTDTLTAAGNTRSTTLEAKTTLYSGGFNEGMVEQAKESYSGAGYALIHARQQVIANTYLAYYGILQAEKNVGLAADAVQRLSEHLSIVQAQYAEGLVIKSDVLRTEVELAQARQNQSRAENACRLACSQFAILLGLPDDQEIRLDEVAGMETYGGSISQAVQSALSHRADLRQALQEKKAAQSGVQIARSGYLPNVTLSLKKEWQKQESETGAWSAQMAVSFNLFDGDKTRAKIGQAQEESVKAGALSKQKEEQIMFETKEAYFNMQNARTAVEIASQVIAKAEEDYLIAQVRYQAGVGSNLDVIDANAALTAAKLNHVNARYDYSKYNVQLAQAMGVITEGGTHDGQEKTTH